MSCALTRFSTVCNSLGISFNADPNSQKSCLLPSLAIESVRSAHTPAGSSGSVGGFGAGILVGATGRDETDRGASFAVICFAVATRLGCATADWTAGGAPAAFVTGRWRITTTGVLITSCERPGIGVFFLLSPHKSILALVIPRARL